MAETPSGGRHRKTTSQPAPSAASSFTAKLPAFLTGRSSATATNTARPLPNSVASLPDADLLTLDLAALIFPPNSTSSPPSPAALALLTRLQTALRTRTTALADALAETSAQADELDEAETRARHLKLQLDGMAARAAAQDAELQALRNDLDAERAARREEADARVRSIALVRAPPDGSSRRRDGAKRTSAATFGSDSGFESEDETYASSISSAARPGASSPTPTTMSAISEFSSTSAPSARPAPPHRQPSTFEKVLRGEREEDEGCTLCRGAGGAASTAWGVVGVLKAENRGLRRRVGELEGAVEGALGLLV